MRAAGERAELARRRRPCRQEAQHTHTLPRKARAWGRGEPAEAGTVTPPWTLPGPVSLPYCCQEPPAGGRAEGSMHSCPLHPPGGGGSDSAGASAELYIRHACPLHRGGVMAVEGQVMWVLACQESHGQRKLPLKSLRLFDWRLLLKTQPGGSPGPLAGLPKHLVSVLQWDLNACPWL